LCAQWGKLPCGAEPRIELGPALQQADGLPTEPRRTKNVMLQAHESLKIGFLQNKVFKKNFNACVPLSSQVHEDVTLE
jgi:hypothetical protein